MTDWRPVPAPGIVLRHDHARDTDLLLLPERVVVLKGGAGAVVALCDGTRSVRDIVDELGERFPGSSVSRDVPPFLGRLREEGWLR
ncbi:pyrroloquinoline quinone biosynthesis peptide chaperone PqqD [Streptomyces sp. NBC_00847]|uniref:pyrroloquinoline quinone biosynthesis peptide chaperone PqqD n=1 Tax=Streptomyces sp. NBC_00847 TaxID=2975850 RepID=UPI002253C2A0|nr:pyrroloquinoline quinone biosynthesis peptide chaperone PqqD [Streptomyces sp. NBC_00847]MCX4879189.1 pyrroloquinoline quinone biosynthesis peptide chaperone PqqD [Streptomyces sp. NBC_00847]